MNEQDDIPEVSATLSSDQPVGAPPTSTPSRDPLDDKVNAAFAGKVVRKDLVRKVKVGANVPVFVLEYRHCGERLVTARRWSAVEAACWLSTTG